MRHERWIWHQRVHARSYPLYFKFPCPFSCRIATDGYAICTIETYFTSLMHWHKLLPTNQFCLGLGCGRKIGSCIGLGCRRNPSFNPIAQPPILGALWEERWSTNQMNDWIINYNVIGMLRELVHMLMNTYEYICLHFHSSTSIGFVLSDVIPYLKSRGCSSGRVKNDCLQWDLRANVHLQCAPCPFFPHAWNTVGREQKASNWMRVYPSGLDPSLCRASDGFGYDVCWGWGVGTTGCSEYLEASNYLKVFTIWKRARFDRITLRFGKGTTKEITLSSGFILHSCLHNFCIKMPGAVSRETLGNWMASCQP